MKTVVMWLILIFVTQCVFVITALNNDYIDCDFPLRNNSADRNLTECQLRIYSQSDTVECVSRMANHSQFQDRQLHFSFVGDSRMRQQFYGFYKVKLRLLSSNVFYSCSVKSISIKTDVPSLRCSVEWRTIKRIHQPLRYGRSISSSRC